MHAKFPQDGAGANLKHKADMAVMKGHVIIQDARDRFNFAESNMKDPAPSSYQSDSVSLERRIFLLLTR